MLVSCCIKGMHIAQLIFLCTHDHKNGALWNTQETCSHAHTMCSIDVMSMHIFFCKSLLLYFSKKQLLFITLSLHFNLILIYIYYLCMCDQSEMFFLSHRMSACVNMSMFKMVKATLSDYNV